MGLGMVLAKNVKNMFFARYVDARYVGCKVWVLVHTHFTVNCTVQYTATETVHYSK